jgi:hypothetical protein
MVRDVDVLYKLEFASMRRELKRGDRIDSSMEVVPCSSKI